MGMNYGISNKIGKPSRKDALDIVKTALEYGINTFDTAQGYGDSEVVLGQALKKLNAHTRVKIITKFTASLDHGDAKVLQQALDESLRRLGVEKIFCIMLHSERLLEMWHQGLNKILTAFQRQGKVENLGISVYAPNRAMQAAAIDELKVIQVPGNILERRFEQCGFFHTANQQDKEIHIRSVFLQGLILTKEEDLSEEMLFAKDVVRHLENLCQQLDLSRLELALLYVKTKWPLARVVFGAETSQQLRDNAVLFSKEFPKQLMSQIEEIEFDVKEDILNPSGWPKKRDAYV